MSRIPCIALLMAVGLSASSLTPRVASACLCSCSRGDVAQSVEAYDTIVEGTFVHVEPPVEPPPGVDLMGSPPQRARIRVVRAYKNEGARQIHPGNEIEIVLRSCNPTPWPSASAPPRHPIIWFLSAPDPDYTSGWCDTRIGATNDTRDEVLDILDGPAFRSTRRAR